MAVDFGTLSKLTTPMVRPIFKLVVKNRSIRFGELARQVEPEVNREQAKITLKELKDAHLIKEKGSAVEDFNTYYVTADGLEASRKADI